MSLYCGNNQLTSLNLHENWKLDNFNADGNDYRITLTNGTFDLKELGVEFWIDEASEWTNGTVNGMTLTVQPGVDHVTYKYYCYSKFFVTFRLSFDPVVVNGGGSTGGSGSSGGGSSTPTYAPAVTQPENGTVTVTPKAPKKGDTVTITPKPEDGYTVEQILVTDKNGDPVEVINNGDGTYSFTQPAGKVTVEVTFMKDNSMLNFFVDVPAGAYYYDAVLWAAENGITGGVDDTHFAPNSPCTRAQIVTFLWRAAGSPEPENVSSFTDVPADSYYAKAVAWAVENGITTGTGDGTTFSPNSDCTRAQIVTFLYRFLS